MAKAKKVNLTLSEQINRALDGRTQRSIIIKMKAKGVNISDVQFTNKKMYEGFSSEELAVLSEILGTEIKA